MKVLLFVSLLAYLVVSLVWAFPLNDYAAEDPELSGGFFEGDIEIDPRNGLISTSKRWPNNVVHYEIDPVFDNDHVIHIKRAMSLIEEKSCIRFYPANENTPNIMRFIGEPSGCHTKVGFRGDLHTLNLQVDALDKGCFRLGSIMHEILHVLGFHHQHSTYNRDDYVQILTENIKDNKEPNFDKRDEETVTDFGIEYDYNSVMHYSKTAFSKNNLPTIVPLQEDAVIGQRRALSPRDIAKLNIMYKCSLQN